MNGTIEQQYLQEGLILEPIYAARAKAVQIASLKQGDVLPVVETLPQRGSDKTRDEVASAIGLGSGKQWDKLKDIAEVWVAEKVEMVRRRTNLSWSHHKEVASLEPDDQDGAEENSHPQNHLQLC